LVNKELLNKISDSDNWGFEVFKYG
jgi:hypothetical protein